MIDPNNPLLLEKQTRVSGFSEGSLYSGDLSKLRWVIKTRQPGNTLVIDHTAYFFKAGWENGSLYQGASLEEQNLLDHGMILEADNRTFKINPQVIPLLQRLVNDRDYFEFAVSTDLHATANNLDTCTDDDDNTICDSLIYHFAFRPAKRVLRVKLIDAQTGSPFKGNYYLTLSNDIHPDYYHDIIRMQHTSSDEIVFDKLIQGQYSLTVSDLKDVYTALSVVTLDENDNDKTVIVPVRKK